MDAKKLSELMQRTPLMFNETEAWKIKLLFVLNLIAGQEFTEKQIMDARDANCFQIARTLINSVLNLTQAESSGLADREAKTVIPLNLMLDGNRDITRRVLAFVRPDPLMLVEIEKIAVQTHPEVAVYQVVVEDGRGGSWSETFTTQDQLRAFLRGIRVTFAMSELNKLLPNLGDQSSLEFVEMGAVRWPLASDVIYDNCDEDYFRNLDQRLDSPARSFADIDAYEEDEVPF